MIFELLAGIVLAALLFSALLWSTYRAVITKGLLRTNAILLSAATLIGMLSLTYLWTIPGTIAGLTCVVFGGVAIWGDSGWSKLLPLVQTAFGVILIIGLPWLGA